MRWLNRIGFTVLCLLGMLGSMAWSPSHIWWFLSSALLIDFVRRHRNYCAVVEAKYSRDYETYLSIRKELINA